MGKTIVLANQKGGVGKTTSTVNLGAFLAVSGKKVLLVDFDPQGNLSSAVGARSDLPGIYEALSAGHPVEETIQPTTVDGLSVIRSGIDLTGANVELVDQDDRAGYLKRILAPLKSQYDFIFVDCPPSLGILTLNGLVAADEVIIPLQCEYFAMEGLAQLLQSIKRVQASLNPRLGIMGIVFTMYDARTRLAQDVVQEVIGYFGKRVFRTIIPRNVRLSEAPSHGVPIHQYDADCVGARNYAKLAEEVLERG
ncbi:MAG: ParA family protein [Spirochaetales bacterium]|nr:MAG: ParA family protein [Spirochaetales bacterium]